MQYQFLRFPGGFKRAATFSYDDAHINDVPLVRLFDKYGQKATFNINSGYIDTQSGHWHLTYREIRETVLPSGHEIAVHGAFHLAPGLVRPLEGIKDILNCRLRLEEEFGGIIRGMAYPDCGVNCMSDGKTYEEVRAYVADLEIAYARTTQSTYGFDLPGDWLHWDPTVHQTDGRTLEVVNAFLEDGSTYRSCLGPKLLYIWGHSFEFNSPEKWEEMETVCKTLADAGGIWFATNMEIYTYVQAYESLVFNAAGTRVYNPTRTDVWLNVSGKDYRVNAGTVCELS